MLKGKKILLGVSGSIAAYKTATIIRLLVRSGAEVKVIMTKSAQHFISALTLSTLSKNKVLIDLFEEDTWANHVMLGRWADLMVMAPASCNTISKMATGSCDNLLSAVYLSATCPVMLAPAMDEDMWIHPATQSNVNKLISYGNKLLPVDNGELASGLYGEGRMAEPEIIVDAIASFLNIKQDLAGKTILITAGPTHEPIDPVRFIGNHSSGKMGISLAKECLSRGAQVVLILGPTVETIPSSLQTIRVNTAAEMYAACNDNFISSDIIIMSAAVADFTPVTVSDKKIKKQDELMSLELKQTTDILKHIGTNKRKDQILVGFALETNNEKENALKKLINKNADYIVLNSMQDEGVGFGKDSNKITIFDKNQKEFPFKTKSKLEVAKDIIDTILYNKHA